jgi:transglutaminase/protease-like cytokinesis protein 3
MCSIAGIESVFINGHGRTYNLTDARPNHAWNAVRLNDKWYLCDVTWASGWVDSDVQRFFKQYNDAYFLTELSLFICNHYPLEKRWSLSKDPPSLKDFYRSTFRATGYIENKINSYSPTNDILRIKLNEKFRLAFTSNADKIDDEVSVVVTNQGDNKERLKEKIQLTRNKVGEYVLEFPLTKKGSFYVRIYINRIDTFVYQVTVI